MIDNVVDTEKPVVDFVEQFHLNGLILGIVLRKVEGELLRDALGVDGGSHLRLPLVKLMVHSLRVFFLNQNEKNRKELWLTANC